MKTILFTISLLAVIVSFKTDHSGPGAANGTLSVIATTHDPYRSLEKADAGCEIYAISETELRSSRYGDLQQVIENFQGSKYDYLLSVYNSIDPSRNDQLRSNFDALSDRTAKFITGFRKLPALVRMTTEGTGTTSVSLPAGTYYLLVISGSVKSNNSAESGGNIGYKTVEIKPGQETIRKVCFQKYDVTGIMMTRNLSGC
jgi:hypothetical protein